MHPTPYTMQCLLHMPRFERKVTFSSRTVQKPIPLPALCVKSLYVSYHSRDLASQGVLLTLFVVRGRGEVPHLRRS